MTVSRQVIAATLVLAAAACGTQRKEVGKTPEKPTSTSPHADPAAQAPPIDIQDRLAGHGGGEHRVEAVDPAQVRIGAATNKTFHRPGCKELAKVGAAEQLRFTSRWEAFDSGYAPCGVCRSGE